MTNLYIGFDWDGTLSLPGVPHSPELGSAIGQLRKQGAKIFIASGRSYAELQPRCAELGLDIWMYCCENGGHIVIPSRNIDHESSALSTDFQTFLHAVPTLPLPPGEQEARCSVWSMVFGEHVLQAQRAISNFIETHHLDLQVFVHPGVDGGVDVVPANIDKVHLMDYLEEDAQVVFFGDSHNDFKLMSHPQVQPHTVANAIAAILHLVRQRAGHIATLPANQGVAELLHKLGKTLGLADLHRIRHGLKEGFRQSQSISFA